MGLRRSRSGTAVGARDLKKGHPIKNASNQLNSQQCVRPDGSTQVIEIFSRAALRIVFTLKSVSAAPKSR
jgi:hypothetical protein